MFKSFFWKIWLLGIVCSIFAICLVLFGVANYYIEKEESKLISHGELLVQMISNEAEAGYIRGVWPYKTLKMVAEAQDTAFLWVIKPDGEIFWADDSNVMGGVANDPLLGVSETSLRDALFGGEKVKIIAQPLKVELQGGDWTIFLGVSFRHLREFEKEIFLFSLLFFIIIIFCVSLLSFYFSRGLTRPLRQLIKGAEIIGAGNLEHRIKVKSKDELGELGMKFNKMTEDLERAQRVCMRSREGLEVEVASRTKKLRELANSLDEQVQTRTKELQDRIDELERFHRLTVGRELKMIELKKNLDKAKKRLDRLSS